MREIDVVVPCGGAVQYLAESLSSVVNQTGVAASPIVVDDTRTPRESEAVARIVQSVPGARYMRNLGVGLVDALNTGIGMVGTECFARMDSDDISLPGRLRSQFDYLNGHPSAVGVGGMVQYIDGEGRHLPEIDWVTQGIPLDPRDIRAQLRWHNVLFHPTMLLRTEAVRAAGGYRDDFPHVEDYDLWLRLSLVGDLINLSQTVLLYRIHEPQVGRFRAREQKKSLVRLQTAVRSGSMPGLGDECPIQAQRFAAVIVRDDDQCEGLAPFTNQSGHIASHVLLVTPSGREPTLSVAEVGLTSDPLVQWCGAESFLGEIQTFARQLPPDMPVVFFGPQSNPDPDRVARQIGHLLESESAWTCRIAPGQSPGEASFVLDASAEEYLRSHLLAEARTLWPRGYDPHAQHPLVDLMSDWPSVTPGGGKDAYASSRWSRPSEAFTRLMAYSDDQLRPRLNRLKAHWHRHSLRPSKSLVGADSPSTPIAQSTHRKTGGSQQSGIRDLTI